MENNRLNNYKMISSFMVYVYDSSAHKLWDDSEHILNFKLDVYRDYINFISDMHDMDRVYMSNVSEFKEQYRFMDKLFELASRYKTEGSKGLEGAEETILRTIIKYVFSWIEQDGYINFKKVEKLYYTTKAFSKEDSPHQQLAGRMAQLKNINERNNQLG